MGERHSGRRVPQQEPQREPEAYLRRMPGTPACGGQGPRGYAVRFSGAPQALPVTSPDARVRRRVPRPRGGPAKPIPDEGTVRGPSRGGASAQAAPPSRPARGTAR